MLHWLSQLFDISSFLQYICSREGLGGFRNQRTAVGKVFKYKAGQAPEKLTQLKAKSDKGVLDPEGAHYAMYEYKRVHSCESIAEPICVICPRSFFVLQILFNLH